MELPKLSEIRRELLEVEDSLTEGKQTLLKELNYLCKEGIIQE